MLAWFRVQDSIRRLPEAFLAQGGAFLFRHGLSAFVGRVLVVWLALLESRALRTWLGTGEGSKVGTLVLSK